MSEMDAVYWWIGVATVWTVALVAVTALLGGLSAIAIILATEYAKKFGNVASNLKNMRAWVNNGKPNWQMEKRSDGKHLYVMAPSAAPWRNSEWNVQEPSA